MSRPLLNAAEDTPPIASAEDARSVKERLAAYARAMGLHPGTLLADIRDLSDQPALCGPDCLTSFEVAELCTGASLESSRERHFSECEDCRALIAASKPDQEQENEFREELARYSLVPSPPE